MDDSFRRALFGAAGELQVAAHEVGVMRVAEADLRAAVRRSLQLLLGARVDPEARLKLVHWPGRLGAADIGVRESPRSSRYTALAECKWCREDKLYEALWDLLKLALASRELELESAYLIVAAPRSMWEKPARSGIRDNAPDNAAVRPTRSASSTSNATPTCDTSPSPSAVTSTVWRPGVGFTFKVSSPGRTCGQGDANPRPHQPPNRGSRLARRP
jgi:hypothetical protein